MSNIRQFPGGEGESPVKRLDRQAKRRRFVRFYIIVLILLVFMAAVISYYIYRNTKVFTDISTVSSVTRLDADGTTLMEFDGSLLTYSRDGANAVSADGKLLWNRTFDMQNPMASTCGDTAAFADYGGSTIYIQTSGGDSYTVGTDKPIRKIAVSSGGYVLAVLEDTSVTWIYMYDFNGTEIAYFRTTMEKSGYPVDIDISPDGELVAVSYYYLDCNEIKSSVAFYNFGDVGQNNIDNYVSGYNYSDTLIPVVRFLDEKTVFALSNTRLCMYSGAHKPVSVSDLFLTDDVLSTYYASDAVAVIYRNNSGSSSGKYRMELYNTSGELLFEKVFDFDYSGVAFSGTNVILYGDTSIYLATYDGDMRYEGNYTEAVKMVIPTSSITKYVFVTENTMDTVEFK